MLKQNNKEFYFTQPENAVMFDNELTSTAKVVYCSLLNHMNKKTRQCRLYVNTIAEEVSRSVRTVQRSLSQLIKKKLVIRTEIYGADGRNLASLFTVVGCSAQQYAPTKTPIEELPPIEETEPPVSGYGDTSGRLINDTEYNNTTLQGSKLPPVGVSPEPKELPTLNAVPEIMRTTARYLLMRTGRKCLEWFEIPLIKELSSRHKPGRIQKEIDRACEIFLRKGRRLIRLSFRYIAACLKNQKTFTPWTKSAKKPLPKIKAYDDWAAMYGDLITGGKKATAITQPSDYDSLIIRGGVTV